MKKFSLEHAFDLPEGFDTIRVHAEAVNNIKNLLFDNMPHTKSRDIFWKWKQAVITHTRFYMDLKPDASMIAMMLS